ncbi:uncharacterized protein LOC121641178 [Melanotaenia boesemani]|uniref:uncharacterized protein LOC121641178 n=1 Tax=Melanotaenia boesemani TaxID=1250792 RepID=UPI001C05AD0E|nr:uncharacterized protein LOC121641178 [Melanotaenia boesemani]
MSNNILNASALPQNLHTEEEAAAIENAIRAAVNTVMKVMSSACSRRMLEYQRMVADRDKEIRRLECKLEESESELKVLRLKFGRMPPENELSCSVTEEINSAEAVISGKNQLENQPQGKSCGVGAAAPTELSPKYLGVVEAFPHQHAQTDTSTWESQGVSGCSPSVVKEEPSDLEPVIKWEVCEGSLLDQLEGQHGAEYQHGDKLAKKDLQGESVAKIANPHLSKLIATVLDRSPAPLKRKERERNGCLRPESEEEVEEDGVKKPCVSHPPLTKAAASKDSLCFSISPESFRQNPSASISSHFQDPLMCQQQGFMATSAPQATCDPILLEVLVSLETIKQQNTTVLKILQSGVSSAATHWEPPDVGALPLPLQSVQDLRSLEQRLSTETELKKKMISYLGLSGGMTTKESVWRIMAKLFTNTLAKNVNWRGRNNKQKIESLTIKKVVLNAVRQNSFCKDAVDEEIERYMKRWLQLAGDRDGGRKRRQEKGKEAMGSMRNYCVDDMFANVIE